MIRHAFLVWWLLLSSLRAGAEIGLPLVEEFTRAELGAQGMGWSATQLRDGRLIFGFDSISVYDGVRWKTEPMPRSYAVRALDAAEDGGFWIGGVNEVGHFALAGDGFHYRSLTSFLPPEIRNSLGDVWNVFSDGPDRAIFVSTSYILQWRAGRFAVEALRGAPRLAGFRSGHRIFIGHRPTGLQAIGPSGFEPVLSVEQLHGAGVVWGGSSGRTEIYATTSGLRRLDHGTLVSFAPTIDAWIGENILTCATALTDGRIAIGTLKGGAMLVEADGSGAEKLDLGANISTDSVHALFEDREGCLWVVCPAGLFRVRPDRAISVVQLPRPSAYPVRAIAPIGEGALVASDTGLWRIDEPRGPEGKALYQLNGFHEHIQSLVREDNNVLVAHRGGISRVRSDGVVELLRAAPSDVFAVARSPDGRLYIALNHGVLGLSASADASEVPGSFPDNPDSLVALSPGTLVGGLYASGVATIGVPNDRVTALAHAFEEETGRAFVAGSDQRLFAVRGHKLAVLPAPDRPHLTLTLPTGIEPKALAAGTEGDAWLACDRPVTDRFGQPTVYHLELENETITATPLRIDVLNQAGALNSLAVQPSARGTVLWIGGESALLRVVPAELPKWTPPKPPELQLVTPLLAKDGELLLPYKGNHLEVNIISPEPDRRPAIRVQTLIDGMGATWRDLQDKNGVALANLQNGRYRLHVRYVAADLSTSPIASIQFVVAPPWWFTPSALVLQLLGAGSFVFGIVRLRLRSLRERANRLEKIVAERTEQLARASEAKSAFVSSMSHELRNPLNGLVASAHALDEERLDPQQRRLLGTVRHCADLLDALIGDVLDMSEIESGTIKLRNRPYNPIEIMDTSTAIVRPIADRKGLTLSPHVAKDVPSLTYGDAFRVQQVLLNLLGNAVKYSETGAITLTLRRSTTVPDQLEYIVEDQGPGISAEEKNRLFTKFSRLPAAREKGIPGTGLGLAVCRELVERMGGRIGLRDAVPSGSVFYFSVPTGSPGATESLPTPAAPFAAPQTALVVEDIDYNAEAMVALLKVMGCHATTASTGAAALARLREGRYDVAFIDCDLPDMSGPDLARTLTTAGSTSLPRLIATTAYADDAMRVRCHQSGMIGYIVKPVTRQKLRAVLASTEGEARESIPEDPTFPFAANQALDLRQLELLGRDQSNLDAAGQRLGDLLQTDLGLLRQASEAGDFENARSIAHRIVSHARFVGAKGLALVASEIERSARDEPELVAELLPAVETQAQQVISALQALKK